MISQNCPRCYSNRIRRGYRHTSLISKMFFRYHLLCDSCNWEFKGFAVPGTVTTKSKKKVDVKRKPQATLKNNKSHSDLEKKLGTFTKEIEKERTPNSKSTEKKTKLSQKKRENIT